jgi:8-oxo-dGTP pyrophosphatase MutT (NUDIX family)
VATDELLHQAGAIPYSVVDGEVRVLLVTSRDTGRWLIPKGNIEHGLIPSQAAEKEAYEEAGVRGRITTALPLGFFTYLKNLKSGKTRATTVEVYALLVEQQLKNWPERTQRKLSWFSTRTAAELVQEQGLARLLLRLEEITACDRGPDNEQGP